jgi:translation initiation factor eIF-2B subunit alpha
MSLASPPSTSSSAQSSNFNPLNPPPPHTNFDIAAHYDGIVKRDPDTAPAIAAIESLIALLSENPLTTIAETLALLSHQSRLLIASQRNPIPLSAGADLFQRYIISSFQARPSFLQHADFNALRNHLISHSRLFIQRARKASSKIAAHASPFVKDESILFTYASNSPVVRTVVSSLAEAGKYVSVAVVTSPASARSTIAASSQSPTTVLPIHELAYALSSLTPSQLQHASFIVPASAVLENGSIVAPLGTQQLALLARAHGMPFYVAAESFKFVRQFPLGCGAQDLQSMGTKQSTLQFSTGEDSKGSNNGTNEVNEADTAKVDITPANLITALITENGTMTPQAVSEELVKLWF